jgi:hypothetical protein
MSDNESYVNNYALINNSVVTPRNYSITPVFCAISH